MASRNLQLFSVMPFSTIGRQSVISLMSKCSKSNSARAGYKKYNDYNKIYRLDS